MAVNKQLYVWSFVLAVVAIAVVFGVVKYWDDARLASIESKVADTQADLDSTRLLWMYGQTLGSGSQNLEEVCRLSDFSLKRQMDKGFALISQMREFEKANLLSNYEATRRSYYLSNFEMWIYATDYQAKCAAFGNHTTLAIFFTQTKTFCSDCVVQGQILDGIRNTCPNLRLITLASDLDLAPVSFLMDKYRVTANPALVTGNRTFNGLQDEKTLRKALGCS